MACDEIQEGIQLRKIGSDGCSGVRLEWWRALGGYGYRRATLAPDDSPFRVRQRTGASTGSSGSLLTACYIDACGLYCGPPRTGPPRTDCEREHSDSGYIWSLKGLLDYIFAGEYYPYEYHFSYTRSRSSVFNFNSWFSSMYGGSGSRSCRYGVLSIPHGQHNVGVRERCTCDDGRWKECVPLSILPPAPCIVHVYPGYPVTGTRVPSCWYDGVNKTCLCDNSPWTKCVGRYHSAPTPSQPLPGKGPPRMGLLAPPANLTHLQKPYTRHLSKTQPLPRHPHMLHPTQPHPQLPTTSPPLRSEPMEDAETPPPSPAPEPQATPALTAICRIHLLIKPALPRPLLRIHLLTHKASLALEASPMTQTHVHATRHQLGLLLPRTRAAAFPTSAPPQRAFLLVWSLSSRRAAPCFRHATPLHLNCALLLPRHMLKQSGAVVRPCEVEWTAAAARKPRTSSSPPSAPGVTQSVHC